MHSNYISEHFNYEAAQERNGQKNGRKHGESGAERGNIWNKDTVMDREANFWIKHQVLHRSRVQTCSGSVSPAQ